MTQGFLISTAARPQRNLDERKQCQGKQTVHGIRHPPDLMKCLMLCLYLLFEKFVT
jgi:hypothetical protein